MRGSGNVGGSSLIPTLAVRGLEIAYRVDGHEQTVLRNLDFEIARGESFGLVGESGCGKSTVAMSIVRYLAVNARVCHGEIDINGENLLEMDDARLRETRASTISMVYQEPGRALNPSMRVESQLGEVFKLGGLSKDDARSASVEMLGRVQISSPERVLRAYPHELSGGMQQRIVIAMALAKDPSLLILDEPTTALDASVGAEVLEMVIDLRKELGTSILLISHNLALVSQMCDRVGVLYAGLLVDEGPTSTVFNHPYHPYTAALLACIPGARTFKGGHALASIPGSLPMLGDLITGCPYAERCPLADDRCRTEEPASRTMAGQTYRCFHPEAAGTVIAQTLVQLHTDRRDSIDYDVPPLLDIRHASKTYGKGKGSFKAVNDVSLAIWAGETVGVVGESGSGKTTLGQIVMGSIEGDPESQIVFASSTIGSKRQRSAAQMVFQNPAASLNRRRLVNRILGRSITKLSGHKGRGLSQEIERLAFSFKLNRQHLAMKPMRLSGGLKQRVAIACAFAGDPDLVVCDEPTSALDVSVQASVLNLLASLQAENNVAYLFVTHDLGVVQYVSDRIAVMYLGQILEIGGTRDVIAGPHHPYTEILLSAVPKLSGPPLERSRMRGDPPDARHPPSGCSFHTRCPLKIGPICETDEPALRELAPGHTIRCHLPVKELPTQSLIELNEPNELDELAESPRLTLTKEQI